jgi:hypothetical protein
MYELGLGISHLKFSGPNFVVWVAMKFKFGNWPKFRVKSTMCYFGLAHFQAALLRIGWNCKNFFKKKSKTLKNKKCEKIKNKNIKTKKRKTKKIK